MLRLFAMLALGIMFTLIKIASERGVTIAENLFFRQLFSLPIVLLWIARTGGFALLRTQRAGAHARRMVMGLTGMALNFGAIILLPMADATVIFQAMPIFATILAALWLGERTGWPRWIAVIVGFCGVLVILQPGSSHINMTGMVVAISGALVTAAVSIQLRDLGRTEAAPTTVFWFSLLSLIPLGVLMLWFGQAHDAATWAIVAAMGLAGGAGQMALTASLRFAPVSVVLPMDYSSLLWATLFGWAFFSEWPSGATWIGAPLIIGSGLFIVWREQRLALARARDIIS